MDCLDNAKFYFGVRDKFLVLAFRCGPNFVWNHGPHEPQDAEVELIRMDETKNLTVSVVGQDQTIKKTIPIPAWEYNPLIGILTSPAKQPDPREKRIDYANVSNEKVAKYCRFCINL